MGDEGVRMAYRFVPLAGPSGCSSLGGDGAFLFAWRMFEISLRVAGGVLDVALLWGVANPIRVYTRSVVRTAFYIPVWAGSGICIWGRRAGRAARHTPLSVSRPRLALGPLARGARRARAGGEVWTRQKGRRHADGTRPVSGQFHRSVHGTFCSLASCQLYLRVRYIIL